MCARVIEVPARGRCQNFSALLIARQLTKSRDGGWLESLLARQFSEVRVENAVAAAFHQPIEKGLRQHLCNPIPGIARVETSPVRLAAKELNHAAAIPKSH